MDTTTQPTTTQPSAIEKVFDFVDQRVGLKTLQAKMLNEPVPGGSRWAYVFGSVLLFIFIMQAVTGILLMFYYVPTADQLATLVAELERAEGELHIAAVAFASQNGMVITDPKGVILRVNQSFTRLTGYSAAEAIGRTPAVLKSGRHDDLFYQRMWNSLIEKGYWQGEIWNKRKSGQIYAELLTITAIVASGGITTHYVASFSDITEDKQSEAEIHRLAYYDTLTRLPNRRLLQDRLGQALAAAARHGLYGALFFIGLDNFKTLNDTRGHDVGDLLLVEVAQCLRARVREGDTVARLGGDEFVLLLDGLSGNADEAAGVAKEVGDKLRAATSRPFSLDGQEYRCKLSIGVSLFAALDTVNELFKRADLALYQAKNAGRDRLRFFDSAMQAVLKNNLGQNSGCSLNEVSL